MGTQLVEQNELKETLELKERIENNTVVELWEKQRGLRAPGERDAQDYAIYQRRADKELCRKIKSNERKDLRFDLRGREKASRKEIRADQKKAEKLRRFDLGLCCRRFDRRFSGLDSV